MKKVTFKFQLKTYSLNTKLGFTLIELIVVISIITLLATAVFAAVNPLEQINKGRDSRKKADLAQIQKALEIYYQDYRRYPLQFQNKISKDGGSATVIEWGDDFRPYMDILPKDQVTGKNYAYYADNTGQSYALYASLERGGKDQQACTDTNNQCAVTGRLINPSTACGGICNYGVSSPNISP